MNEPARGSIEETSAPPVQVPVAISARHVHLTQETLEQLFGADYQLRVRSPLLQLGQYAAEETVVLVGPRGRLSTVRIVGPTRSEDQVELSRTDAINLGVDAPVRESGDLSGTPGIVIEGPVGKVTLERGVICALRHIHMSAADAAALGIQDQDRVSVKVLTSDRKLTFSDIVVRVSPVYRLELHLDADEGNAAGLHPGDDTVLVEIDNKTTAAISTAG
jgi:acetate kinase